MNNIRAFVAVEVSNTGGIEKLQQELVCEAGWTCDQTRPVKNRNLHFTLIFLGVIHLESIDKIKDLISEIRFEPIKITFTGIGGFPNSNFARVVWVGVDENGRQKLVGLAEQVVLKLSQIGFRPNKPFTPHLTIFRVKGGNLRLRTELLHKYGKRNFGSDISDKVHLKRSDLTPSGPVYTNIFTVHAI